jgi:hypothetical protein
MRHPLDPTTHTVEMSQIAELNLRLKAPQAPRVSAAELGLIGPGAGAAHGLTGADVVVRLSWDGSPTFPDIYAHFGTAGSDAAGRPVRLHTAQLRELSSRFGLHHRWGV